MSTLFIKDYLSYMTNQNLNVSNWHYKLIERSLNQTYYQNEDKNDTFYYLNYKLTTFHHKDMHCKNAYYYKSFTGDTSSSHFKRIVKCKPSSLQMQAAYNLIQNFNLIDSRHLNTRGVRNVAKRIYFKVNCWSNVTLEAILMHKLYVSQCKFQLKDKLMFAAYPYCKCKFSLTNGQCLEQGNCLLCMALQHSKLNLRFRHPIEDTNNKYRESTTYSEYLYCFCD